MKILFHAVIITSLLCTLSAHADWVKVGVAARCDNDEFAIVPTAISSSSEYNIYAPDGFKKFDEGAGQHYKCTLGNVAIEMIINVYGPQPRGMGQGAGVIIIDSLVVGGKKLIDKATNFNWQVSNERVLTKIRVAKQADGYNAYLCYSHDWRWDEPYRDIQCETTAIDK